MLKTIQRGELTYYYEESMYRECAELLAGKEKNDKVMAELESLAKRVKQPLDFLIYQYLVEGSIKDNFEAREWFNVFEKYFNAQNRLYFSLALEGYTDLQHMLLRRGIKKDNQDFRFLRSIKYSFQFDNPILIIGETGTSKETVAHVIHNLSTRSKYPLYEINSSAIPEQLLESELFGYEKGAHSTASKMKKGRLEIAKGGTIFLDELGKMPLRLQAKLLKVVEEKKVSRIGSEEKAPIDVDVRFIAAVQPNDLEKILPDLLYRMGYPDVIKMPTLNERLKYVPRFALESSLKKAANSLGVHHKLKLSSASYNAILSHNFKGNYRELENILRYAIKEASPEKMLLEVFEEIDRGKAIESEEIIIEPKHFSGLLDESGGIHETKNLYPLNDLKHVKLKDIIEYADSIAADIIERKICETKRHGKDVKNTLIQEGFSNNEYQNFTKKVRKRTGKGIREIRDKE